MSTHRDSAKTVSGKGASLSTPGLLALMSGLALLYSYWMFGWAAEIRGVLGQVTVVGGGALITLWGLIEVIQSLFFPRQGRRSKRTAPSRRRQILALSGLAMMGAGAGLGFLVAIRAEFSLTVVLAIVIGVLMFVGGLRNFFEGLQPSKRSIAARKRQRLPVSGVFYLAIMSVFLVGSLIGRSNMLMLVFALMAGPFILNGWMTRRMLTLSEISRKTPPSVMAGQPIDVEITLRNGRAILSSWLMDVEDTVRGRKEELQTDVLFTRVPPRQSRRTAYRLRLMQRGRYAFGPLVLSTRFPLGVVERGLSFDDSDEIIVHPRLGRLTDEWKRDTLTATELVERERPHSGIYDDEFHRLREFRWGDNPRAIHWRTSARRNEFMVREYHQSRDRDLVVLLDLWLPDKPTASDRDRVELAVSFTATLCVEHMRLSRDAVVTLSAAGDIAERWQGQAGPASFDSLLRTLALINGGRSRNRATLWENARPPQTAGLQTVHVTTNSQRLAGSDRSEFVDSVATRAETKSVVADPNTLSRYFDLPPTAVATGASA
ncbi:MAG: DUF58 domain-containing protein [Planctomycetaceae bacterium]